LYRDQHLFGKASEQLTQAHDLTQELIRVEDFPVQQDRLGVILTTHGEIFNRQGQLQISGDNIPGDSRTALDKQQRAVRIFRQLEQTTSGPLRDLTLRKLMKTLISMADTPETLELYEESQAAIQAAQAIGKRAQSEDNTSHLHLHQRIAASTKNTMGARRELDDLTSTLHVGNKIRLHGLINQTLNGKKGTVLGAANNNRISIQLQGEQRQVSIRIVNIRYWDDPEQNCHTLYDKVVAKAQSEIELLRLELQILIQKSGSKHIDTARARFNLGRALWLSNKPLETTQAVEEFDVAIRFMTQREPNHQILIDTKAIRDVALDVIAKFKTKGTLSAWPYWKSPTARWENELGMTQLFRELLVMTGRKKELTITPNTMLQGLHRYTISAALHYH